MLDFVSEDGVEDPVKTENWVDDDGDIVQRNLFVCKRISKKAVRSACWVKQTPVHYQIPDRAVHGVDRCAEDEQSLKFGSLMKSEE